MIGIYFLPLLLSGIILDSFKRYLNPLQRQSLSTKIVLTNSLWKFIANFANEISKIHMDNEIILYQPDTSISLKVRVEDETVWLTQAQMTELFQSTKQNISLHINNIFKEGELSENSTVKYSLTIQKEGNRTVKRKIAFYNLDVIISVGYRVKSKRGTDFRIWATKILKDYMLRGYAINERISRLESTVMKHSEQIEFFLKTSLAPAEGVFFNGQIWDAYVLINDLIRSAQHRVIVIDNYADDSVLTQLDKRNEGVSATIYTFSRNRQIHKDIERHNQQYPPIQLYFYNKAHDRFLIIDNVVFHIGASFKDLGKKLFAFSKMESLTGDELLEKLNRNIKGQCTSN